MTCDWPVDRTCYPAIDTDDPAAVARRDNAEAVAVQVLWSLSGRQFGACPVVVRPCPPGRMDGAPSSRWNVFDGAHWAPLGCGCAGRCSRGGPAALHLPGPVQAIVSVTIAGVVLDPAAYRLERDVLYRVGKPWPAQDLGVPVSEPGGWSVVYTLGAPVPAGVAALTGVLAAEFMKACSGADKCRLPRNVSAVSRQGISYQVYDPTQFYALGLTGLAEVDMWLSAVNPTRMTRRPTVV